MSDKLNLIEYLTDNLKNTTILLWVIKGVDSGREFVWSEPELQVKNKEEIVGFIESFEIKNQWIYVNLLISYLESIDLTMDQAMEYQSNGHRLFHVLDGDENTKPLMIERIKHISLPCPPNFIFEKYYYPVIKPITPIDKI